MSLLTPQYQQILLMVTMELKCTIKEIISMHQKLKPLFLKELQKMEVNLQIQNNRILFANNKINYKVKIV
jgi:hypothetical protein